MFQPIIDRCPPRMRHYPAIVGLFPLIGVCFIVFAVLLSFGLGTYVSHDELIIWVLVVLTNTGIISLGIRLVRAQEHGDLDPFRAGPLVRYPLLLAASYFTIATPGRAVAVLWLWWTATGLMGCKAR